MGTRYKQNVNSEEIYRDLLYKIINLDYEPGESISENDLCEKYGTTRHAIRGALAILKEKGLIEVIPQKGTYVSLIDLHLIDDVVFLRSAVEQESLHEIFKMKERSRLVRSLRQCLKKQTALEPSKDNATEFYELDDEFHRILLNAAGRSTVQRLYEDAYLHFRRWRNMEVGLQERIEGLPGEHQEIIDAIEQGDEAEARKSLGVHIDSVNQFGKEMRKKYPQFFVE